MKIQSVIMAGGQGKRLWPLSTRSTAKQFVKILDNNSLLQKTLLRNQKFDKPLVMINKKDQLIAKEQLLEIDINANLLLEPTHKNTAVCAVFAALYAKQQNIENVLLLSSDHVITDDDQYFNDINTAIKYINKFGICMIGVKPTISNTRYGYIRISDLIENNVFIADKFTEKPTLSDALNYVSQGNYLWNSGIFIFSTSFMIQQIQKLCKDLYGRIYDAFIKATIIGNEIILANDAYNNVENESLDKAIIEHISSMGVVKAGFSWYDVGGWRALWELSKKDNDNNCIEGRVITKNVINSHIVSKNKLTTIIGLQNITVIDTDHALFIAHQSQADDIQYMNTQISDSPIHNDVNCNEHQILKPWGYFKTIDHGDSFKVKHMVIYPNHKISMQCHKHRSEHWIIIKGKAKIYVNNRIKILSINDSVTIPKGIQHRLENIHNDNLHLIEVQLGQNLSEDDIVRFDDIYGRV